MSGKSLGATHGAQRGSAKALSNFNPLLSLTSPPSPNYFCECTTAVHKHTVPTSSHPSATRNNMSGDADTQGNGEIALCKRCNEEAATHQIRSDGVCKLVPFEADISIYADSV